MARRQTKAEFIESAKLVHGNKYDYSRVEYINNRTKVTVICPQHGAFDIAPAGHVPMKYGCAACGGKKKKTTEEFIKLALVKHNGKYNYSKVDYLNTSIEVIIGCPIHGDFMQTPFRHLQSYGCTKCSLQRTIDTKVAAGLLPPQIKQRTEYELYVKDIRTITNRNYRLYKDIINPHGLTLSHQNGYHLDHVYSKRQGYTDNVPAEVIGHWTNLRIIDGLYNITKNLKCDKTLEQLYIDFNKAETK